jgi:hypothetical protein
MAISGHLAHVQVVEDLRFLRVVETAPLGVVDVNGSLLEQGVAGLFDAAEDEANDKFTWVREEVPSKVWRAVDTGVLSLSIC